MKGETYFEYAFVILTKQRQTWIYFKALSDSDARFISKGMLKVWDEENEKAKYGNLYNIVGNEKRLIG